MTWFRFLYTKETPSAKDYLGEQTFYSAWTFLWCYYLSELMTSLKPS